MGMARAEARILCLVIMAHGRGSIRVRRRLPVSVGTTRIFSVDIGEGGFSAEIMRVQAPGSAVTGTIRINGAEVDYAGRVAWVKPGAPHLSLRGRMGVCFTTIPPEVRLMLGSDRAP